MKTSIDYALGEIDRKRRQDAAWYADGSGSAWVATVYHGDRFVHIRADGAMSVHVWRTRKDMLMGCDSDHHATTASELFDAGIRTDRQLLAADDRVEWFMNPWYDIYDGDTGEWLNDVTHTVEDAVASAVAHLREAVLA